MKRHSVEVLSLISGLTFLGFAITYLITGNTAGTATFAIMLPLLLVGLGVAGIAATIVAQRSEESLPQSDSGQVVPASAADTNHPQEQAG